MSRKAALKIAIFSVMTWSMAALPAFADPLSLAAGDTLDKTVTGTAPAPGSLAAGTSGNANFGDIVSVEAKKFRDNPIPGYRNFGAWVSAQRRHKKHPKDGSDVDGHGPGMMAGDPESHRPDNTGNGNGPGASGVAPGNSGANHGGGTGSTKPGMTGA